jgi:hypothetical protein
MRHGEFVWIVVFLAVPIPDIERAKFVPDAAMRDEYCGDVPPAELEAAYYAQRRRPAAG